MAQQNPVFKQLYILYFYFYFADFVESLYVKIQFPKIYTFSFYTTAGVPSIMFTNKAIQKGQHYLFLSLSRFYALINNFRAIDPF